jgi:CBS domain-containing protein
MSQSNHPGADTVGDLMTTPPTTVGPDETVGAALELMLYDGIRHLPVVEDDSLIGLVSERDLLPERITRAFPALRECPVRDAMATALETAAPGDAITDAAARMAELGISSLPVVANGRLVGILTSTDILAERGRDLAPPSNDRTAPAETVMQRSVTCVSADDGIDQAVATMVREQLREVPVVDRDDQVVGMLSERSLRAVLGDPMRIATGQPATDEDGMTVATAMTPDPTCVNKNASLYTIARCFLDDRVGTVPVIDQQRHLVGMVTYLDLVQHLLDGRG